MPNKKLLTAAAAIVVLFFIGVVVTHATIPDHNGVIDGSYNKSGSIRVIDNTVTNCSENETALNWNQTGTGTRFHVS